MDSGVLEAIHPIKNVSYLYARDPSIIAWGGISGNCRANLNAQLTEATTVASEEPESDTVSTYLRIKTSDTSDGLYEILDEKTLQCRIPEGSQSIRNVKKGDNVTKKYTFTKIFSGSATQNDLFCEVVKPKLLKFLNGSNYTLLSYGASGSGKTYTVVGTAEEPGLIPRALEYVFRSLPQLPDEPSIKLKSNGTIIRRSEPSFPTNDKTFRDNLLKSMSSFSDFNQHIKIYNEMQQRLSVESVATVETQGEVSLGVFVSFAEIYNEHIYDLLMPQRGKHREILQLGNHKETTYIKNLTMVPVSTGLQAFQILQYGLRNLKYAATGINNHSSRSHCIFTIKLVQASEYEDGYNVGYFNFCDLAGSERVKKTLNVGDRLKESNSINTSLLVLGRCISAVRTSQKHKEGSRLIPFRESKLTQLFRRALSGFEDISMIVNINPSRNMFDESYHVLNFSAIAKDIIIEHPQVVRAKIKNRFSDYMQSRSTSIAPISEKGEDVARLNDLVAELEYENAILNQEANDIERKTRAEVIQTYKEIVRRKEEWYERQIASLKEQHQHQILRLKQSYESRPVEIIDLDSSSSDDSASNRIEELQNIIKQCETELEEKDRILEEKDGILEEKEKILEDAVKEYTRVQQENDNLSKEILKLREELDLYKMSVKTGEYSDEYNSQDEQEENMQMNGYIENEKEAEGESQRDWDKHDSLSFLNASVD